MGATYRCRDPRICLLISSVLRDCIWVSSWGWLGGRLVAAEAAGCGSRSHPLGVSWVPPGCLPGCSLGAQMSPRCLPDVSWMLPKSIQFTSNQINSKLMKPNMFRKVFSTFHKSSNVSPARFHQQNSNAAVCDHCQATQQHCYFADGPSRDMAYETKCVLQSLFNFSRK